MALDAKSILDQVTSHAMTAGYFDLVNTHEPKNPPGNGLSCAIWVNSLVPTRSGLTTTSVVLTLNVRIYNNMKQEPQDEIDLNILSAVQQLMNDYSGDFDLGSTARNVDLLGEAGTKMFAQAGYLTIDNKMYRVMVITLPIIVNDVWTQAA